MTNHKRLLIAAFMTIASAGVGVCQTGTITSVSGANYRAIVAPDSIVSGWGTNLATSTASGTVTASGSSLMLPTSLDNTQLNLVDSMKASFTPSLYLVSPSQINYVLPANTALGAATLTVETQGSGAQGPVLVSNVSPGIITVDGSGNGVPAAQVVTVSSSQQLTFTSPAQTGTNTPAPISLSSGQVYLMLYGTGIRRHSLNPVIATVNGVSVPVPYAGAQSQFPGLDQLNVGPFPTSLAGSGSQNLIITVDGVPANTVQIAFQ